ncbi:MAG TPA: DUF192 domain-containing protein [Gaiellaceae bacterium]|jgi:uncharacterized membrane protein (UPF0127 family)|nr:DUF192 domain-containing protein [Gaiellaceae bacterium]
MARAVRLELDSGAVVCESCLVADKPWTRMRGLLGRSELPAGEGILLRPCGSVHMMFMRFPIDVVFCDRDLQVLSVVSELRPWRFAGKRGAKVTFELAAGEAATRGVAAGARLRTVDA